MKLDVLYRSIVAVAVFFLSGSDIFVVGQAPNTFQNSFPGKRLVKDAAALSLEVAKPNRKQDADWYEKLDFIRSRSGVEVMIATKSRVTFISFRGSYGTDDWITNFNALTVPFDYRGKSRTNSVEVHKGYNDALFGDNTLMKRILRVVERRKLRSNRIVITGHSKGGGEALLVGAYLQWSKMLSKKIYVISFGAPMVGNWAFHQKVENTKRLSVWRFVLRDDPVPRVPPNRFAHAGHLVQLEGERAKAYFHHYGDKGLGLRGAPDGWDKDIAVINAVDVHRMRAYREYLWKLKNFVYYFEATGRKGRSYPHQGKTLFNCDC